MEIIVLRLGHRIERDRRVTTHVGLCSRALGAQGMLLAASDQSVVSTIRDVVPRWEIAALIIFLDRVQNGQELAAVFSGRMRIVGNVNEKVGVKRSEPIE